MADYIVQRNITVFPVLVPDGSGIAKHENVGIHVLVSLNDTRALPEIHRDHHNATIGIVLCDRVDLG